MAAINMTSHPEFNASTTGSEAAAAFSNEIKGKVVVITGISPNSIGSATATAVAARSPSKLILASRTQKSLEAVYSEINGIYPDISIDLVTLDLSSVQSITAAASEISSKIKQLDVLINNAGLTMQTRNVVTTPDKTEVDLQLFTNYIGPFLFTELLLPKLLVPSNNEPRRPRVVNLSSHGHRLSPVRFSDYLFQGDLYLGVPVDERPPSAISEGFLQTTDGYPGFIAYGQSKTANILHSTELNNRFQSAGKPALAISVHPGTIDTGLSRNWDETGRKTLGGTAPGGVWKTTDQGAATTIVAAFDPKLSEGEQSNSEKCWYMADCQPAKDKLAPHAADFKAAARLREETEKMLGIPCEF